MATPVQIAQYASKQLWFGNTFLDRTIKQRVATATAIALAESSGNETVISPPNKNGTVDTGLWQINSVHLKAHPTWTTTWLQNPNNNAKAMATLSGKGLKWGDWAAYNNGNYKKYMDTAKAAVEGITLTQGASDILDDVPIVGDVVDAATGTLNVLQSIADPIIAGAQWIGNPRNWVRIIEVGGGIALGLIAVGIVARPVAKDIKDTVL